MRREDFYSLIYVVKYTPPEGKNISNISIPEAEESQGLSKIIVKELPVEENKLLLSSEEINQFTLPLLKKLEMSLLDTLQMGFPVKTVVIC